jgi:DNA-binding MarR family transcriptional regulator
MPRKKLSQSDYSALAEFRYVLRRFLNFSEKAARKAGLTPRQHQALLVIKGYRQGGPISVGDLAERLIVHHHSAVELTDRLVEAGLVSREQDPQDHRRVLLHLTERAEACLADLSAAHLDELARVGPMLRQFFGQNQSN